MTDMTIEVGGDVAPGTYVCELVALEKFTITSTGEFDTPAGEIIDKLRWEFMTEDNTVIEGSTSMATGPRSKMRAWMSGIGVDLSRPAKIDLRDLVGRKAMVTVALNDQGYATIASVVPLPRASGKK